MRIFFITLVLILLVAIMVWVRSGDGFHIARVLPFCGGHEPGLYDVAALGVILILLLGLKQLYRPPDED